MTPEKLCERRPANFTPAGKVVRAWACDTPAFIKAAMKRRKRTSGAKASGIRYERRVNKQLLEDTENPQDTGITYLPGVWFGFLDASGRTRYCQPDGLLIDLFNRRVTIVEIKVRHTLLAWWQVRALYQPVIRAIFKSENWPHVQGLEIVRAYEPMEWPERFHFTGVPHEVADDGFGVMKMRL